MIERPGTGKYKYTMLCSDLISRALESSRSTEVTRPSTTEAICRFVGKDLDLKSASQKEKTLIPIVVNIVSDLSLEMAFSSWLVAL